MATEKTPAHKRIVRAEGARDDWKGKAIRRREENEKLKEQVEVRDCQLIELNAKLQAANRQITALEKRIDILDKTADGLKKKSAR